MSPRPSFEMGSFNSICWYTGRAGRFVFQRMLRINFIFITQNILQHCIGQQLSYTLNISRI